MRSSAPQVTRHPRSRIPTRSCRGAWRAHCGITCLQPRLRRPGEAQSKVLGGTWGPKQLVLMGTGSPSQVPNIWPSGLKQSHGFRLKRGLSHASSQARLPSHDMSLWAEFVPWGGLRRSVGPPALRRSALSWAAISHSGQEFGEPEPMVQHQQLSRSPAAPARKAPRT